MRLLLILIGLGLRSQNVPFFLQRFSQLQLKNRHRQIANSAVPELSSLGIKKGRRRGILRDTF
jgi:hypothetical protein